MVDLNDCDREPIHIPGTIQPYGVLFALAAELKVTQVSENVGDHLPLGVEDVLGGRSPRSGSGRRRRGA